LTTVVLPPDPVIEPPDPDFCKPDFVLTQLAAADALRTTVDQGGYTVTLLAQPGGATVGSCGSNMLRRLSDPCDRKAFAQLS